MGQGSGAQGTSRGFNQLITLTKLIDDPLVEGSNAGSTNKASDLSQSSGGRRNSDAQKGAACS